MSETTLVNAALIYLRTQGCMVWRANTGAMRIQARGRRERFIRFGPVGQPDIVGYGPDGCGIACECKRGRNQPTDAQREFLAEAKQRGVFAVCVWTIDELIQTWEKQLASSKPPSVDSCQDAPGSTIYPGNKEIYAAGRKRARTHPSAKNAGGLP